jgi:hypothetical protein
MTRNKPATIALPMLALALGLMAAATTATGQAHAGSRVTPLPTPIKTPSPELIRKSLLKQKLRKAISNAGKAAKKTGRNTGKLIKKAHCKINPAHIKCIRFNRYRPL